MTSSTEYPNSARIFYRGRSVMRVAGSVPTFSSFFCIVFQLRSWGENYAWSVLGLKGFLKVLRHSSCTRWETSCYSSHTPCSSTFHSTFLEPTTGTWLALDVYSSPFLSKGRLRESNSERCDAMRAANQTSSLSALPINTKIPQTFAHLLYSSKPVSALFDSHTILIFWL